ncbi:hypothetical protein ACJX0J_026747, partial [Zea mays]
MGTQENILLISDLLIVRKFHYQIMIQTSHILENSVQWFFKGKVFTLWRSSREIPYPFSHYIDLADKIDRL